LWLTSSQKPLQQVDPSAQAPPLSRQQYPAAASQIPWQHSPAIPPAQVSPRARQQRGPVLPHVPPQQAVPVAPHPVLPTGMQPHWPAVPLPPHASGAVHPGQVTVRVVPQLSVTVASPHCTPARLQSWAGGSGTQAQALFTQERLGAVVQLPQSAVRGEPQESVFE